MKKYFYSAISIVILVLIGALIYQHCSLKDYKAKYEVARSNNIAYECNLKKEKGKSAMYYSSLQDLKNSNDSLLQVSMELQKKENIKPKNTDYIGYSTSNAHKVDTVYLPNDSNKVSIIRDSVDIDTILENKWYKLRVNVKSPNRLIIAPEFKSERHIIIYTKKEYKNKRSKIFFIRWFQKKINVAYITLEEKNPYIDVKQQKLVKIIK